MNQNYLKIAEVLKPRLYSKTITIDTNDSLDEGQSVVYDFKDHYVGYLKVSFKATGSHFDAPALLKVKFCENKDELEEDVSTYHGWISKSWIQEEMIHLDVFPCTYNFTRRYAFRYVKIEVVGISNKYHLQINNLSLTAVSSVNEEIKPIGDNDLEIAIDKVALKTLSECMQTEFEDGPKRDQRLWLGDLRLQAMTNYVTFKKNDLVKRCLYLFAGCLKGKNLLTQCIFTKPEVSGDDQSLFDYSLLFIPTVLDYFEATKDLDTVKELLSICKIQIEAAQEYFENDVMKDYDRLGWCFLDWTLEVNKQAGAQAVYIYCEKALIKLLEILGEDSTFYQRDVDIKTKSAIENFYDETSGLFVSGKNRQLSYATNVWYVLAEVFDSNVNKNILEKLESSPAIKPVTPYMMHHYIQALINSGLEDKARNIMDNYWGGMVKLGADTFFELYNPENPNESPYGGKVVNSFCHAWSCTPAYFLRKYFMKEEK